MKSQIDECHFVLNLSSQKLANSKNTLLNQAKNVKEQIKSNIDVQIKGLNQRRNWLLNQLEVVKTDKIEAINRQEDEISCEIYEVDKMRSDIGKYTNVQIQEKIDRVKTLLSVDTKPFIAFRADTGELREFISQYGNILNQYSGHFADPTRPSVSLPRMVEEEDDEVDISKCATIDSSQTIGNYYSADIISKETRVINIAKRPEDSYVVKAWLMSNNSAKSDELETDVSKTNSETDSFVKLENASTKSSKIIKKESNEYWLLKKRKRLNTTDDIFSILQPFETVKIQNDDKWLMKPSSFDDDKDLDHHDFVNKTCKSGTCKSFQDCLEKENCCNRLVDQYTPSYNQWLINNSIVNKDLLTLSPSTIQSTNSANLMKFDLIMKSDKSDWLLKQPIKKQNDDFDKLEKGIEEICIKEKCDETNCDCQITMETQKWLLNSG